MTEVFIYELYDYAFVVDSTTLCNLNVRYIGTTSEDDTPNRRNEYDLYTSDETGDYYAVVC